MAMHEYQKQIYKKIGTVLALIILPILGFFGGMQYQKQNSPATASSTDKFANGPRMMRNRAVGNVKAVTSTSIAITERFNNTDKTYTLTNNTTYKNGTSDAQASDIKTGDTVLLTLDSNDSSKAVMVTANPTPMVRGGAESPTGSSGSDTILQ